MRGVDVPADNQLPALFPQGFAVLEKRVVKIQFVLQALFAAGAVGKIHVEQIELWKLVPDVTALHIESFDAHFQMHFSRLLFGERGHPAVTPSLRGVPDGMIPGGLGGFRRNLIGMRLGLLQAHPIGRGLFQPFEKSLFDDGAHAVDVPAVEFHS